MEEDEVLDVEGLYVEAARVREAGVDDAVFAFAVVVDEDADRAIICLRMGDFLVWWVRRCCICRTLGDTVRTERSACRALDLILF